MRMFKRAARVFLEKSYPLAAATVNAVLPPFIVLAYHRVADLAHDPQLLAVSRENFASQLGWMAENNIEVVRFDEPWKVRCNRVRVCITFDDGYADNYHNALPILEKYAFPATFFVTTAHVRTGNAYWWDVLEHILYGELPDTPPPGPFAAVWPTPPEKLYQTAHGILLAAGPEKQRELLEGLCQWLGHPVAAADSHRPLRPDEVAALAAHPLATVGAHTHTHPRLSQLLRPQQKQEVETSLDLLTEWTGRRPSVFAYPFGSRGLLGRGGDYNADSMRVCKELGILRAAANYPAQVRPWTNRFAVPRHLVRNWDKATFARRFTAFLTEGYF